MHAWQDLESRIAWYIVRAIKHVGHFAGDLVFLDGLHTLTLLLPTNRWTTSCQLIQQPFCLKTSDVVSFQ